MIKLDSDYSSAIPDYYGGVSDRQDLNHLMNEMFCTNTKCSWQGPIYRSDNRRCPYCGSKIRHLNSNDGFFFHGHVPKKIYPKPDYPEDYEPYERPFNPDGSYRLQTNTCNLPLNYMYYGYDKIKAGKGYNKDGTPRGVLSGKCSECDGQVISIKMNTSSRGFETTSEKVCDKCGLTVPGSFQVLEAKEDYKSPYSATHEEWMQQNNLSNDMDDTDMYLENYYHIFGGKGFGEQLELGFWNRYTKMPKRLEEAIKRLSNTPQSMKIPTSDRRKHQYHLIADDYIHMLELSKYDALDIHHYIDTNKMYMGRYKVDDIIYNLCLVIGKKDLRKYNNHNKNLYDLLREKLSL